MGESAEQLWLQLDGKRTALLNKCKRFAELTIPSICPLVPVSDSGEGADTTPLDYQSAGAQMVNHLTNKLMLALFRPTQPFFRVRVGKQAREALAAQGMNEDATIKTLSALEMEAMRVMEKRAQRPKLYAAIRHLIVTGNVLLYVGKESLRVMGLRYYAVKRDVEGSLHTLIVREVLPFNELTVDVQQAANAAGLVASPETDINLYRVVRRESGGNYREECWVNQVKIELPAYTGNYTNEANCPWKVLTWELADEANYGTGLVGNYVNDFEALSTLCESTVDGAVQGSEFRWMVNPTGQTSVEDLNNSKNGDALAGKPEDIAPTQGGNPEAIKIADSIADKYERRLREAFLMTTGVIRDAERVTAEEVRRVAQELETAYGGVYSLLGATLQGPVAHWLLDGVNKDLLKADIEIIVLTGLDAISRGGDLDALVQGFKILGELAMLPESLQSRIKFQDLAAHVGAGVGQDLSRFIMSDEEFKQIQDQQAQSRVAEANATAAGEAAAQGAVNG